MGFLYMVGHPPGGQSRLVCKVVVFQEDKGEAQSQGLKVTQCHFGESKSVGQLKFKEFGTSGIEFMVNFNLLILQSLSSLPEEFSSL